MNTEKNIQDKLLENLKRSQMASFKSVTQRRVGPTKDTKQYFDCRTKDLSFGENALRRNELAIKDHKMLANNLARKVMENKKYSCIQKEENR